MSQNSSEHTELIERLGQCQREQTKITLYVLGQQVHGTVIRVTESFVDLRGEREEKALVRLKDISTVIYR